MVAVDTFYRPPLKKVNSMVTDRRTEQQESERWLQTDAGTNINSKVTDRREKFNKSTHGFNQTKKNSNKGYRQMIRITTTNNGYRQTKEWTNTTTATLVTDRRTKTTAATTPQRWLQTDEWTNINSKGYRQTNGTLRTKKGY